MMNINEQVIEQTKQLMVLAMELAPQKAKLIRAYVDAFQKEGFTYEEAFQLAMHSSNK